MTKFSQKLNKIIFFTFIFFVSVSANAQVDSYNISQQIENLIYRANPNVNVGIEVMSLNTGTLVYERNAYQLLSPASSLKTFTAAAALSSLGPDYRFQTKILSSGFNLQQGVLTNNLYVYFDGDPLLKRDNLDELVEVLEHKGVRSIRGDIYIDDTIFDQSGFGPGWYWDERNYCYAAPTSAITIDKNCFGFNIVSPRKINKIANLTNNSEPDGVSLISSIIGKYGRNGDCKIKLNGMPDNSYYLNGCMRPKSRPIYMTATIQNPRLFAKSVLEDLLRKHHIKLLGEVKFGEVPAQGVSPIAIYYSNPLGSYIKIMLKKSDNVIANALYKKLGNTYFRSIGTWESGAKAVAGVLHNSGVPFNKIRIVDGSGLSRDNLVSPYSLAALLYYVYGNPGLREQFLNSLPIGGIDGHLEHRMHNIERRVIAKTGTEKGIVSLSGYIYTYNNQVLVFSIIVNNFSGNVHRYQKLEEKIVNSDFQGSVGQYYNHMQKFRHNVPIR
jgi:D-alanyl-D-alanine carboxypeptidase/D-alanyl-D-alanine-endopeptidase (penicillin-binding protein 4)